MSPSSVRDRAPDDASAVVTVSRVLVVNAGSTSVKLRMLGEHPRPERSTDLDRADDLSSGLEEFLAHGPPPDAAGHRVVHGGDRFVGPTVLDAQVRADLDALTSLAPLHNPPALDAIDELARLRPDLPAVACFDTAFHQGLPTAASTYAFPEAWRDLGVHKFGFHGLSCAWSTRRAAALLGRAVSELRLVICHLGGGASVTAVDGGRSVDTTMGFTPTAGLVMATRPGDVDAGALMWLQRQHGITVEEMDRAVEQESGLRALSGTTGDLKELVDRRHQGEAAATLAVDVYVHRLVGSIAAIAAALGGFDALVFTGGVGEHSAEIRAEVAERLGWLGVSIDAGANDPQSDGGLPDRDLSAPDASRRTLVIEAREDLVIAEETRLALRSPV